MRLTTLLPLTALALGFAGCASEGPHEDKSSRPSGGPAICILLRAASSRPAVRIVTRSSYEATEIDSGTGYAAGSSLDRNQPARGGVLDRAILVRSNDGVVYVDGIPYPGDLLLEPVEGGVQFILRTDLERYLPGVLAAEMSVAFHAASLRAQAIASRTYAMHRMQSAPHGRRWHVTDDTGSQVFVGLPQKSARLFNAAVADTRGMVLVWGGRPLPAYFHSTCGGHTAALTEAFDEVAIPPLVGSKCDYCRKSRFYRWSTSIPAAEAGKKLSLGGPVTTAVKGMASRSGRCDLITFTGRSTRRLAAADARMLLGPDRLYSTRISDLQVTNGSLEVRGSGWGHGVGLCQMGAWGMAVRGASAADILAHYYPGAELLRLY